MPQMIIPVLESGEPAAVTVKTSTRSNGDLMVGRWSKTRRGVVEARLDLTDGAGKTAAVARFELVMN
jgi:hypothetical protein